MVSRETFFCVGRPAAKTLNAKRQQVTREVSEMATLIDLQEEIRLGIPIRRNCYPENSVVWDRGDGLLVSGDIHGRLKTKPFSLEEILADDWETMPLCKIAVDRKSTRLNSSHVKI